jgi:serine/threonine-protein kinase RsbW
MSQSFSKRFVMPSRREAIESAEREVLAALQAFGYDHTAAFAVRLAMQEALTNALLHGNKSDPARFITLECTVDPKRVIIEVADQGEGFDPASVPDPTADENRDIPAGRGLMLMRSFMAEVIVHAPGNRVSMKYVRPCPC